MKIAAVCATYLRPHLLGELIECFRRQDYPADQRELIILDDAGQYDHQEGDGWRLVSVPQRFCSLGEKFNALYGLVSSDVEAYAVAGDDDLYLPHWLSTLVRALRDADWTRPSKVYVERNGRLEEHPTGGLYHAAWGFRRSLFERVGGYPFTWSGCDQAIAGRFKRAKAKESDSCQFAVEPYFVCRLTTRSYHLSWRGPGQQKYLELQPTAPPAKAQFQIGWKRDYLKMERVKCTKKWN